MWCFLIGINVTIEATEYKKNYRLADKKGGNKLLFVD